MKRMANTALLKFAIIIILVRDHAIMAPFLVSVFDFPVPTFSVTHTRTHCTIAAPTTNNASLKAMDTKLVTAY